MKEAWQIFVFVLFLSGIILYFYFLGQLIFDIFFL